MVNIILTSHGDLAHSFLKTLTYFSTDNEQVYSICLEDMGVSEFQKKVKNLVDKMDGEILVMTDMFQGTPFKAFYTELIGCSNARIISNVGLPHVLTAVVNNSKTLLELSALVMEAGNVVDTECIQLEQLMSEDDE